MYQGEIVIDNRTTSGTIVIGGKDQATAKHSKWLLQDGEITIPPVSGETTIAYTLEAGVFSNDANLDRLETPICIITEDKKLEGKLILMTADGNHLPDTVIAQIRLGESIKNVPVNVNKLEAIGETVLLTAFGGGLLGVATDRWEVGRISLVFNDSELIAKSSKSWSEVAFDLTVFFASKII